MRCDAQTRQTEDNDASSEGHTDHRSEDRSPCLATGLQHPGAASAPYGLATITTPCREMGCRVTNRTLFMDVPLVATEAERI